MSADLIEDRDLALQLHKVLSEIDPARWREGMGAILKPKLQDLQFKFARRPQYATLAQTLKVELPALDTKLQWLEFKRRLQSDYIELAKRLRAASIHIPSLRPTNYARNLFHITAAIVAVMLIEFVANPTIVLAAAAAWAAAAWAAELSRRFSPRANALMMKLFSPVAHAHEAQRINSATWYATALLLLALTQSTLLCVAGVAVLGIGDPAAAIVGRRFGRIKLMHGRSLEGTLAFVATATIVTWLILTLFHPMSLPIAFVVAAGAAVAGALAELVSFRVDDNFSIPLSAAVGVVLMTALMHVAL